MTYVEQAFQQLKSNLVAVDSSMAEGFDELIEYYLLVMFTRGQITSLVDVHDAWAIWRMHTKPDHKDIVPFAELSDEVQSWDRKYAHAICKTAKELDIIYKV